MTVIQGGVCDLVIGLIFIGVYSWVLSEVDNIAAGLLAVSFPILKVGRMQCLHLLTVNW